MSSKITVSLVAEVLKQHKAITPALLREIVEELNATAQSEADEPVPRTKTQFVVVSHDTGHFGWVFQIPEEAAPQSILARIDAAAHSFNASKKGRLLPVKNRAEAMEVVSRKHWKEAGEGTVIKTRLQVPVIMADMTLSEPPTA